MSHRLMAVLEFDAGQLRELLQLPETAEIVDARMDFSRRGRIQLKIEGAGFPTQEGHLLNICTAILTTQYLEDGTELLPTLSWPFAGCGNGIDAVDIL